MRKTAIVVIAVVTALCAGSALAAGNSPSRSVYQPKPSQVQGVVGAQHTTTTQGTTTSKPAAGASLPFTGADLAFLAGSGFVLIVVGYSLRRITRKPPVA